MLHAPTGHEWLIVLGSVGVALLVAIGIRLITRRLATHIEDQTTARAYWLGVISELVPGVVLVSGLWAASGALPLRSRVHDISDRFLYAILALIVTTVVSRVAVRAMKAYAQRSSSFANSTSIFTNILRIAIYAVGFMVILQSFKVSITPLLTALGVGGIAVALALQDTLSNLFAGIHLLASKKVEPGDYVELSTGQNGYVIDVNWRNTVIRQLSNNMIIVPNSLLASQVLINYNRPEQPMSLVLQCGVAYDSDLEHVESVTIEVAREILHELDGGVDDFDPMVRYHTFGNSSIDFSIVLRVTEFTNQYLITHEFMKRLKRRYDEEGIEIPFPIRTIVTKNS